MTAIRVETRRDFLALGDSYTIGEGVDPLQCWPAQLVARLREQSVEVGVAEIVATTGWTTDELKEAIDARDFTPPYALVSLLIGVNNQYRGRDLDSYADEFSQLLEFAVRMAGGDPGNVIGVSIPDWGTTKFAATRHVDAAKVAVDINLFNAIAQKTSITHGVNWVDVTGISRGEAHDMLAEDGLHPSADQYALWVKAILPVAHRILEFAD